MTYIGGRHSSCFIDMLEFSTTPVMFSRSVIVSMLRCSIRLEAGDGYVPEGMALLSTGHTRPPSGHYFIVFWFVRAVALVMFEEHEAASSVPCASPLSPTFRTILMKLISLI